MYKDNIVNLQEKEGKRQKYLLNTKVYTINIKICGGEIQNKKYSN